MSGSATRRRLAEELGVTLSEMLMVLVILGVVLAAMTTLFVSASTSQIDQTARVQAQQEARLALDALRREIRCTSAVTGVSGSSISITLDVYCPTYRVGESSVTWCTKTVVNSKRYALLRYGTKPVNCGDAGGVQRADYLTTATIFTSYSAPAAGSLRRIEVTLPVDVTSHDSKQRFTLKDEIALRNAGRG